MVKPLHLQVSLLLCLIIAVIGAIPGNEDDYLKLIEDKRRDFRGMTKTCKTAISLLHPDHNWHYWRYDPSYGDMGLSPVIDPDSPVSPPDETTYGNYFTATSNNYDEDGVEIYEVIENLDTLYEAYRLQHGNPRAISIHTRVIPCYPSCAEHVIAKLKSDPYNKIETKIVVYSACGTCLEDCKASKEAFDNAEITLIKH